MGETRSILVVDGSASMTAMLQRFLQPQHVDVRTAGSVAAAETLLAQPFRLQQLWHILQQAWPAIIPQPAPPAPTSVPAQDALYP